MEYLVDGYKVLVVSRVYIEESEFMGLLNRMSTTDIVYLDDYS